jgi:hypothetical protein
MRRPSRPPAPPSAPDAAAAVDPGAGARHLAVAACPCCRRGRRRVRPLSRPTASTSRRTRRPDPDFETVTASTWRPLAAFARPWDGDEFVVAGVPGVAVRLPAADPRRPQPRLRRPPGGLLARLHPPGVHRRAQPRPRGGGVRVQPPQRPPLADLRLPLQRVRSAARRARGERPGRAAAAADPPAARRRSGGDRIVADGIERTADASRTAADPAPAPSRARPSAPGARVSWRMNPSATTRRPRAIRLPRRDRPRHAARRRPAPPDRRGRPPRRHLEPRHLREGHRPEPRLRRRDRRAEPRRPRGRGGLRDAGRGRRAGSRRPVRRAVYERSGGAHGYVSLEVSPRLAHDTEGTSPRPGACGRRSTGRTCSSRSRAPPAGLVAVERLVEEGVNVNVTLLFGLDRYADVAEAYLRGLERRAAAGQPLDAIASVASFFLSRIDVAVDAARPLARPAGGARGRRGARCAARAAIASAKGAWPLPGRVRRRALRPLTALGARPSGCCGPPPAPRTPPTPDQVRRAADRRADRHDAAARDARRLPRGGDPALRLEDGLEAAAATSPRSPTSASTSTP